LIQAAGEAIVAELKALPQEAAAFHPAPGEWCAKECVGHLLESERRGFNGRIRQILAEPGRKLQGWDQVEVARERNDCERSLDELLREFVKQRRDSVALVLSLTTEQMELSGEHEKVGRLTVRDLLHEWQHHDRNHLRQMQANVQAYVWPNMGNAQRFSGE